MGYAAVPSRRRANEVCDALNAHLGAHLGELSVGDELDKWKDPDEEVIHLLPNDLAFFPPWNGDYET
jgi:hypothetical protein